MNPHKKTICLLSAYRSDSHGVWTDWLVDTFNEFNWYTLELPGRHFRWRIRGNPLSWLNKIPEKKPDLIIATSMVDLATLKGLHPHLADVPCIYYFHENQFAYPTSKQQHDSVDPQMVQLYGALSASKILFNSAYNRDSFLLGVKQLLNKLPDEVPENLLPKLTNKAEVLPVAINNFKVTEKNNPQLILWNHRWEYDKAPQVFVDALLKLNEINPNFQLALLGSRGHKKPAELLAIENALADKIIFNQKLNSKEYRQCLSQASIVVSTAIHEFQGLAVLEAVNCGVAPLVPNDLCYQEQYAERYRYTPGDSQILANRLNDFLQTPPAVPDVSDWSGEKIKNKWQKIINRYL